MPTAMVPSGNIQKVCEGDDLRIAWVGHVVANRKSGSRRRVGLVKCLTVRSARHPAFGPVGGLESDDRSVRAASIFAGGTADLARFSDLPFDEVALDRCRAREEPEIGDESPESRERTNDADPSCQMEQIHAA